MTRLVLAIVVVLVAAGCRAEPDEQGQTSTTSMAGSPTTPASNNDNGNNNDNDGNDGAGPGSSESTDGNRDDGEDRFEVEPASWSGCGDGFECATVTVPLDHDQLDGQTIDLALVRVPAADRDGSGIIGSILVNPGGPGGSGVDYVRSGFRFDAETMDDHHLVGFDPRGVGASNPLSCNREPGDGPLPDYDPDDAEEQTELDEAAMDLAERCQRLDGDLLPHLSTASVVADLDLLRQAVGDERLSYMGLSYGTLIGLRYAERHPDRIGRMILDGVVDPATTLTGLLAQQADGFDRVFAAVDQSCDATLECPDGGLAATYDRVAARLDTGGPVDGIGPTELAVGTLVSLYAEGLWPRYAAALAEADRGDTGGIEALYRLYADAADEAAYNAVVCTDTPVPSGSQGWDRLAEQLEQRSPRFGAVLANEVRACAHWPVRSAETPEPVSPEGIPPILVLSTTGDAATPLENAVTVAAALEGAGLVTVDETSHTAYGRSFCVQEIVADFVATGAVPDGVHRC